MEDLQRNLEKELTAASLSKSQRPYKRWTLLFVGDHGKTIAINRFKGLLFVWLFLVVSALSASAVLYALYRQSERENVVMNGTVGDLQRQIKEIRNEKDILMARLVVTEAELGRHRAKDSRVADKATVAAEPKRLAPAKAEAAAVSAGSDTAAAADNAGSEKDDAEQAAPAETENSATAPRSNETAGSVAVEDLKVTYESNGNAFKARFTLRSTRPATDPIAGYTAVVLKSDGMKPQEWITLPTVTLEAGRPVGLKRGQYFSIARFKTVRFRTVSPADPSRYDTAEVFVFDAQNELIFEKSFPIGIDREQR